MTKMSKSTNVEVSLVLRGKELDPDYITAKIGIMPELSFRRGEKRRKDPKEWPHGLWMVSSSEQVKSSDLIDHLIWMIEKLEAVRPDILEILQNSEIDAVISCFWIMINTHETFIMNPDMLKKIASFNIKMEFDIYSP